MSSAIVDEKDSPRAGSESTAQSLEHHDEQQQHGPPQVSDDEYPPLGQAAVVMVALFLSMFLVALDRLIVSTVSRLENSRLHTTTH